MLNHFLFFSSCRKYKTFETDGPDKLKVGAFASQAKLAAVNSTMSLDVDASKDDPLMNLFNVDEESPNSIDGLSGECPSTKEVLAKLENLNFG